MKKGTVQGKLSKFTRFANSLYPHELVYLLEIQQFDHPDNIKVLNLIFYNSNNPKNRIPYDISIDKRRYSYIKKWIEEKLSAVDVDIYFEGLNKMEKKVMTDGILPQEEKKIIQCAKSTGTTHYYFIKFYELLKHYRDYLLVRGPNENYAAISDYLEMHSEQYLKVVELNEQINQATLDIVHQHAQSGYESMQWDDFLKSVLYSEEIDGYTRYRAAVRLTYMYYNYREFKNLRSVYDYLDKHLKTQVFYSKRILANYYANRAMMHSKLGEPDDAEKYGYLSIQHRNADYIFYLLNLCSVLLKRNKNNEALEIMRNSIGELKNTGNYYYKIGFAAFYTMTLTANKMYDKAVDYAERFYSVHKKEIMNYRWHLFFSAYFKALTHNEEFAKIINLSNRYALVDKEKQSIGKARYLPILYWHQTVARYMEGDISAENLKQIITESSNLLIANNYKQTKVKELFNELSEFCPRIFKSISKRINF